MLPLKETVGTTLAVPSTVDVVVSVKVTVPVGPELPVPEPVREVRPPNVAVSWSAKPEVINVAPAANVTVGVRGVTVTETGVAVAAPKVASPEYDAPIECTPPVSVRL